MVRGRARLVLVVGTMFLPWPIRRFVYVRLLGWQLAPSARIGLSVVIADRVQMAEGSRIGHLNVVRSLPELVLGEGSAIHQWNWLTVSRNFDGPPPGDGRFRGLRMGAYSAILLRHYLDCSGGITIRSNAMLAGVRSTFMTHQVDARAGHLTTGPIDIGEYALISSDVRVTPGGVVPARSVVAMGAVVAGRLEEEGALYGGVPARVLRRGVDRGGWFTRRRGVLPVDPRETRARDR